MNFWVYLTIYILAGGFFYGFFSELWGVSPNDEGYAAIFLLFVVFWPAFLVLVAGGLLGEWARKRFGGED